MLFDELQEQLKTIEPDIDTIKSYWENANLEKKYQELHNQSIQENFWQNPKQTEVLKELTQVKILREQYQHITTTFGDISELIYLFKADESELKKLQTDMHSLRKAVGLFKINLLLNEPDDQSNSFMSINSGAGGTESQDWAEMLLRMYIRFCEREKFNVDILDYQSGEGAGIKSATLFV